MRTSRAVLLLAACALAAPARAAGPNLSPVAAAQLDQGLRELYALDYAKSRASFRRIIELEPDNPFGYLFEAGGIWWESSQEYGLFASTPTLQGLFEEDVDAAVRKADAYIGSKDARARADGYFVSGMALGTLGQWRLMKRHYLDAYFAGKKAVKNLKKCLKLDSQYYEASLGLGVFDYQAAHMSGVAKLGFLFGMRGDEKKGLENIRLAMDKSRYANAQAAQFLLQIYMLELHDDARALAVAQRLRQLYPESPYYVFLEALLRRRLGDWDGSLDLGRALYRRLAADPESFRPKWLTLACGLSGGDCFAPDDVERTLAWIDHALESAAREKPDGFSTLLRLFRGEALELLGRRDAAAAEYKKVLLLPPADFAHERARACLAAPCGRDDLLRRLRALAAAP